MFFNLPLLSLKLSTHKPTACWDDKEQKGDEAWQGIFTKKKPSNI